MKPANNILEKLNVNYDDIYERFDGDEELMIIFIKKLPSDDSFNCLKNAVLNKNFDNMLAYSHKLKGLCANLGLDYLSSLNNIMVQNIKNNIPFSVDEVFGNIEKEYLRVIECIKNFE